MTVLFIVPYIGLGVKLGGTFLGSRAVKLLVGTAVEVVTRKKLSDCCMARRLR